MSDFAKTVLLRFLRGALASAVAAMVVIAPIGISSFTELKQWLVSLVLVGLTGFVSGGLQAIDKAYRFDS